MFAESTPGSAGASGPDERYARSFGQAADLYDGIRPGYPVEALQWLFGDEPLDVVDVGAGTGLLTRGLIALGHHVTAVEPDRQMLDKLVGGTTDLTAHHRGSAEELPLEDASADVVTAGQAYHWFDRNRALPQFRRVLRPGGFFAPIWNIRDESVDWVRRLSEVIGSSKGERTAVGATGPGNFTPYFGEAEFRTFPSVRRMTPERLMELVKSRSYYLAGDEPTRQRLRDGIRDLLRNHPQLAGREEFEMPYMTYALRVRPRTED